MILRLSKCETGHICHIEKPWKSAKIAVARLDLKILEKKILFAKKNIFFTRFGFSNLLSSSKSKKVTAKTKNSKKRRNANFGPPELKNGVPQGEKRPF